MTLFSPIDAKCLTGFRWRLEALQNTLVAGSFRRHAMWVVLAIAAASNVYLLCMIFQAMPGPSCSHRAPCGHDMKPVIETRSLSTFR